VTTKPRTKQVRWMLRVPESLAEAVRSLADRENNHLAPVVRRLISIGLECELESGASPSVRRLE
jgi:hypothetical protein